MGGIVRIVTAKPDPSVRTGEISADAMATAHGQASDALDGMLNLPVVGADSWVLGFALMLLIGLLVGALPASSAMRLNIVDALAGR